MKFGTSVPRNKLSTDRELQDSRAGTDTLTYHIDTYAAFCTFSWDFHGIYYCICIKMY